ncbi:hypothetical protein A2926_01340 [Candidatus Giovannonibacteria bacterium RIFCSPLOWO2_01_FULL_44_40]|uniref:Uncharacterized protein n=1 Tax=Candidatus Giovannonibacteria bacterium RIFCSPHIGHO2_01_FULL_45_23 TaxID=1798325 RepID=A0A1F5VHD9_9BACT|nr:MAG: hypothetical protein A2834_00655 [Candidatus Giovannonibacteria bacterium RIFCSPHIGHO2_01_FULL_45_23]OGF75860.1 MAG: hypothetical protein A3C77_02075 [Candidatus Giovannonibacteria bacterium RIFCSPHIGHO2_02_FULL_45_13]OGF79644.1 MAG: hypothetical protein A2926_01340 [Candidatus Giovannonibacteria bacterium RIFCSPLOWO2_01_FULL_44_40]
MNTSNVLTIPKTITGDEELVVMPKREFKELWDRAFKVPRKEDVLRWSREAKLLKQTGKLPVLRSLKSLG